jgi:hypothetical protein
MLRWGCQWLLKGCQRVDQRDFRCFEMTKRKRDHLFLTATSLHRFFSSNLVQILSTLLLSCRLVPSSLMAQHSSSESLSKLLLIFSHVCSFLQIQIGFIPRRISPFKLNLEYLPSENLRPQHVLKVEQCSSLHRSYHIIQLLVRQEV